MSEIKTSIEFESYKDNPRFTVLGRSKGMGISIFVRSIPKSEPQHIVYKIDIDTATQEWPRRLSLRELLKNAANIFEEDL
jgi:hypothetical protein